MKVNMFAQSAGLNGPEGLLVNSTAKAAVLVPDMTGATIRSIASPSLRRP